MGWTEDEPVRSTDLIGQLCGASYVVQKLIGEGGMGQVYLARSDELGGKLAAVKVLQHELMRRPESLVRFRAEAFAAGSIDDENIVHAFDTGRLSDGRQYMMMEYCAGGSLAGMLEARGKLPLTLALTTAASIGSALTAAHLAKITHRDIKPGNILFDQKPGGPLRAKLADFGIAKIQDDQLEMGMRTGTKKMLGSPGYMAPEQVAGAGRVDHRADVYAFASCIYEMVTGRRPYPGSNMFDLVNNVIHNAPFPRPTELRPDLPPDWEREILMGLSHRREDRLHSIRDIVMTIARSVPNGEALVSYVAPRFIENKVAPTAATIADGIGPAVTVFAASHSTTSSRGLLGRTLGMLGLGLVLGTGGTLVAGRLIHPRPAAGTLTAAATPAASDAAAMSVGADAAPSLAAVAPDAAIPDVRPAHPPADAGSVIAAAPRDAGVDAHVTVASATPVPTPTPKPPQPEKPVHVAPVRAEPGTLHIEVDPWAEVAIAGQNETYTTPVTTRLPAGHYQVTLSKGSQKETIDVTITPDKTTRINRSW